MKLFCAFLHARSGNHVWAADSQLELDDWISQIKQAVQEDRLKRRRTKGQSLVVASGDDTPFELNAESGLSYKNRVDSGKPLSRIPPHFPTPTSRELSWSMKFIIFS